MTAIAVGIDISKEKFDVALLKDEQYAEATFENTEKGFRALTNWLKKRKAKEATICLEATGRYGEQLAAFMYEQGYAVSVVNPLRIKKYADSQLQRNKTDAADARLIAHFCATQPLTLWTPPTPEVQELQALARRIDALKAERTRELNRQQAGLSSQTVLDNIGDHISYLDEQIAQLEKHIDDLFDQHPNLNQQRELLESIPGIGPTTSAFILAEVPDVTRFDSASQLAAYAGLTPKHHQSGSSVNRRPPLSKVGKTRLRAHLYFPALVAMRFNPLVSQLAHRMKAKGHVPMSIVGAAMRKLIHLAYGVLKHQQPFDPNYLVNLQDSA